MFWPSSQVAGLRFTGTTNYMPTGKELVIMGKTGSRSKGMYRIGIGKEQTPVKIFGCQGLEFRVPAVSEDGTAVAVILQGKPSYLAVASTSPHSRLTRLCEVYYASKPSWHPEGRMLLTRLVGRLNMIRLGGLDCRPVSIAAERKGNTLSVVLTSQAGDAQQLSLRREASDDQSLRNGNTLSVAFASQAEGAQQLSLRWEAFDADSLRIGLGEAEDGPLGVKPKEKAEWTVEIDPAIAEKAQTIKIRALNENGRGAVKLVDWQE